MSKEYGTILVHPAIASLSPNNPAGIDSLLRVVHGGLKYLDLNESLLLNWMLNRAISRRIPFVRRSLYIGRSLGSLERLRPTAYLLFSSFS